MLARFAQFLLVFSTVLYIESCQGASLTFVIDDTRSMDYVIEQVGREVDAIMNYVFDEKTSQISNIVLVTFNDPVVKLRKITRSRKTLKAALSAVRANNYFNTDCPEMALSGVKLALESSEPGSYIYVFTDASAKDYYMNEEIKQLCQKKQSQVVFFLTGDCNRPYSERFQVYYDIATASSGMAFRIDENEIDAVLRTIHETIKGNKTLLSRKVTPPDVYTRIPFWIDEQTESAIITASGTDVSLQIHGRSLNMERIMWTSHGKVVKLKDPSPGNYVATVRGTSATSVVIVGRSDLYFHHGFSEQEPEKLDETVVQPFSDTLTHLAVLVTDPKHAVYIKSAQILDMKENVITELPLKAVNPNFYTTKLFVVPSDTFKVSVIGETKRTGQLVKRIANMPVTPLKPPPDTPVTKAPVVEIAEGASVEVTHGSSLTLTCKVFAYPEPEITWTDNEDNLKKATTVTLKAPYEYVSYLKIQSVSEGATYNCHAENARDKDDKTIVVVVKDSITVVHVTEGTTKIRYGNEYTLNCDVRAQRPLQIRWYHVDRNTGETEQVRSSEKYSIVSEGKQLKILSMDEDLVGKYTCKAQIRDDPKEKREFTTDVEIYGLVAPKIDPDIKHKTVGEYMPTTIICKILKAVPEPKISWLFKAAGSSRFQSIPGSGAELRIPSAGLPDAGSYRCVASNAEGRDERTVAELEVVKAPAVVIKEGAEVTVKYGGRVTLTCKVTASPLPTVTWTDDKHNTLLAQVSGSKNAFEYTYIATNMKQSGKYMCRAENNQGIKTESIQVTVTSPFKVYSHPPDDLTGPYGNRVDLKCDIRSDLPMKINWYYESASVRKMLLSSGKSYNIASDGTELNIESMDEDLIGAYTCKAFLINDPDVSKAFTTNIDIGGLVPPYIDPKIVYLEIEENNTAIIPCKILKGVPKPKISWLMMAAGSSEYRSIAGSGPELRIEQAALANSGHYKCAAVNAAGHREQVVAELVVLKKPAVTIVEGASMDVPYGTQLTLTCRVLANPEPTIVWKNSAGTSLPAKSSTSKNDFEYTQIVTRANVKASDSGKYSCRAINAQGSTTESIQVSVSSPFTVHSHPPDSTISTYGTEVKLKCDITSKWPMEIRWYYEDSTNEKIEIEKFEQYTVSSDGAELKINEMDVGLDGEYTCRAALIKDSNEHVEYTTQVQTDGLEVPEITGDGNKKVKVGSTVSLKCKVVRGLPKPTLSWRFTAENGTSADMNNTGDVLHISKVTGEHAGYYECIATNNQGTDKHAIALNIEERPRITSEEFTVYEGIEGDVALRIPCEAIGHPKPTFTWKVEGTLIKPGTKYAIEDGALIIKNPERSDSNLYTCKATNSAGSNAKTFKGVVDDTLKHYGTRHNVYILENQSKKLMCTLPRSSSSSVNWFIQGKSNGINKPYMKLENAKVSDDGDYSCHVSDTHGSATETYVVDVGYPPTFTSPEHRVVDWKGDTENVLQCSVRAKPQPNVQWTLNDKPLVGADSVHLSIIKWGHYKCNVSNIHGAVQREFDVKPSVCMISRRNKETPHMPLILTDQFLWPDFNTSGEYLITKPGDKLVLSCPNPETSPNAFQRFPARSEVEATCDNGDTFIVDGTPYQLKDLQCTNNIYPTIVKTNSKCLTETSELITVGFELQEFVTAYTVCFDYMRNIPLYTHMLMSQTNDFPSPVKKWFQYPGIGNGRAEPYTCEASSSTCCYAKTQLASATDFSYLAAQNSSFVYPLNAVPNWRPCNTNRITWEKVGELVRSKLNVFPHLNVWSGIHTVREENGGIIPRYLWKVVRDAEEMSIVIVHVNDPSPTAADIRCQHDCVSGDVKWLDTSDKYTYCCTVADFIEAFDMPGTIAGESLEPAVAKNALLVSGKLLPLRR